MRLFHILVSLSSHATIEVHRADSSRVWTRSHSWDPGITFLPRGSQVTMMLGSMVVLFLNTRGIARTQKDAVDSAGCIQMEHHRRHLHISGWGRLSMFRGMVHQRGPRQVL